MFYLVYVIGVNFFQTVHSLFFLTYRNGQFPCIIGTRIYLEYILTCLKSFEGKFIKTLPVLLLTNTVTAICFYYAFEASQRTPFIGFVEFEAEKKIILAALILWLWALGPLNSLCGYVILKFICLINRPSNYKYVMYV